MFDELENEGSELRSYIAADAPDDAPENVAQSGASLVGRDTRKRIYDPRQYPYSTVCALLIHARRTNRLLHGTGVLVSPNLVLTAGHNLFNNRVGGDAYAVDVFPALNGDFTKSYRVSASRFVTVVEWKDQADWNYDYGAILLPTTLGQTFGWMSVQTRADGELVGLTVSNLGYPIDCPAEARGNCPVRGSTMWLDSGKVAGPDSQVPAQTPETQPTLCVLQYACGLCEKKARLSKLDEVILNAALGIAKELSELFAERLHGREKKQQKPKNSAGQARR